MNWSKVITTPDGCMEWTGARKKGSHPYGLARHDGRMMLAHRAAWLERVGPLPEGVTLDHLCRNPPCVNVDHLEPVTQKVNLRRSQMTLASLNAEKTECPSGHQYDDLNTYHYKGQRHCRACRRTKARERRKAGSHG